MSNSEDIAFLAISSGNYRSPYKGRLVVLVFQQTKLIFIMKFYKSNNIDILQEFQTQKLFNAIYPELISKPILCEKINEFYILVEKPVIGKNFKKYFFEHLDRNSTKNSIKLILNFYKKLNSQLEQSNFLNMSNEITSIFENFIRNYPLEKHEINFIYECKSIFYEYFKDKVVFQRYSNNDFIFKNFIISNKQPILVDFEFTKKTTLYFFEWFQFFKYNWSLSNDYIHDLFLSEIEDPFFHLALHEFSKYKQNDKFSISCRLIFEICEFEKKLSVFSNGSKQILKKDMRILLNDLKLRFNNQVNFNLISDLSKTEKKLFDITYEKLTNYKKTFELNSLKNSINDKDFVIDGLEKSLNETNLFLENAIKEKDKIILGHEDSINEQQQYIEKIIREKNEYIEKIIREKNEYIEKIIREKDRIILGHEISIEKLNKHISSINNSKIWKFIQFFLRH
ncbi:hypothetical protein [Nitrosopumilus sp. b2]|uniref:hypothetical protein n=1 Tax=Nitrosopumilus sp. b2 TaxID=2109908 RepID=UPI001C70EBD4|nr:hypothetical protein [Nitrosopumilus sp. b2]